jgi:flagellar protein FlbD
MIVVHRLTQPDSPIYLNPDLGQMVESTPDTVITLVDDTRLIVAEPPAEVAALVRHWKAEILAEAFGSRRGLELVDAAAEAAVGVPAARHLR